MDIVERLRGHAKGNAGGVRELLMLSADEIEHLRQQVAELVRALDRVKTITDVHDDTDVLIALNKISKSAIAKTTGGE